MPWEQGGCVSGTLPEPAGRGPSVYPCARLGLSPGDVSGGSKPGRQNRGQRGLGLKTPSQAGRSSKQRPTQGEEGMESCPTVAMGGAGQVAPGPERAEEAH